MYRVTNRPINAETKSIAVRIIENQRESLRAAIDSGWFSRPSGGSQVQIPRIPQESFRPENAPNALKRIIELMLIKKCMLGIFFVVDQWAINEEMGTKNRIRIVQLRI